MIVWGGSYRSRSASGSHPARATAASGIRRLVAALDGVALPPQARAVELSEWAHVLEALRSLHPIAASGATASCSLAALTFRPGRVSCSDAGAPVTGTDARNERRIR